MPANYVLLEKITVGAAGASSVTFSGIPQTGYTDLKVVLSGRNDQSGIAAVNIAFNGSTANLSYRSLFGDGSSVSSFSGTNPQIQYLPGTSQTANTFNNAEMYIPNYAGSTNKSFSVDQVQETNATTAYIVPFAGLWSQTAAITSITFSLATGNFVANSTFYLYGVAKLGTTPAIVPYATGGDTIMTDGTYWYHTFLSSGTFTPQKALSCDYLVVAGGGGGGGNSRGGGGGAGGLRCTVTATGGGGSLETALSLGTSAYTVTIGAGGAPVGFGRGLSGSDSVFSSITSTGGGGGGEGGVGGSTRNGLTGGSGGGGGGYSIGSGGSGTTNQGYAGGVGSTNPFYGAGGGGGAGAIGATSTSDNGAAGGNGVTTSISGTSTTYAGGGGGGATATGGAGGTGGGGAGVNSTTPNPGTANTGGGGGGGNTGGNGGSGIVIVRYAV